MSTVVSGTSWKSSDGVPDQFPAGLRVLAVDDDPTCLMILGKMLKHCLYEVTSCNRAEIALQYLRDNKNGFDIVISDVHMPDMDGFKLLEQVGLEMDLPVIMMSADDSKNVVMKGVTHGACDYLIKPVRLEAVKNIWQHVVRKRKNDWKDKDFEQRERDFEQSGSVEDGERKHKHPDDADYSSSANEGNWKSSRKRKEEDDDAEDNDDTSTMKKPRVVWSVELHQQFVAAVNQLGIDKAVPKKILELMNVPGLTRENVASHLQKYRLYLRRLSGVSQHPNGLNGSFMGPPDANFAAMSSLHGFDFQALATNQIPPQSLASLQAAALSRPSSKTPISVVDSRNLFSFKSPNMLGKNTEQINLLHGIPTNMEPKQLATLNQSVQVNSPASENSSMIMHMNQNVSRAQMLNEIKSTPVSTVSSSVGQPILLNGIANGNLSRGGSSANGMYTAAPQGSPMVDFSMNNGSQLLGNSYSHVRNIGPSSVISKGMMMPGEVNMAGAKKSRSFVPNHEYYNEPQQYRSAEWGLQNVGGSTFDPVARGNVEVLPSTYVQSGLSSAHKGWQDNTGEAMFTRGDSGHNSNFGLPLNPFVLDNSSRIKVENIQDASCPNNLFAQPFGQDDIFNALLKQQDGIANIGTLGTEFGFDGYTLDNLSA